MLQHYFSRLYAYNEWANERILSLLEANPSIFDGTIQVNVCHYLAAQDIWITRILGQAPNTQGVWTTFPLAACRELHHSTAQAWNSFVATMQDSEFTRRIAYKNTKGDYYETPIVDIMAHNVNHATYHRAQVNVHLRQAGITPVNVDFITYAREVNLPDNF